jgi:23S rRNA pseudouridine2605 synthase
MTIRLQKFIADAGIASRRKAETMITEGRVSLNGSPVTILGTQVDPEVDHVRVDGKKIQNRTAPSVVYALYKPKSCVTTLDDPQGRNTIVQYFPRATKRLFPVGRLDYDSEGLILLTNDGELAQNISHPGKHVWKEYFVKVKGKISSPEINRLKPGPVIDGKKRQSVKIRLLHTINDKSWLSVSLQEGLKHHLKKMFGQIGFPVLKIKRYSIGNIGLEEMKPGEIRKLSKEEISDLIQLTRTAS